MAERPARHRFRAVRVADVSVETPDAVSLVLEPPAAEGEAFAYRAGQFVNVRVEIDGVELSRSYSMSSAPAVDDRLQITVKRTTGGRVSNWINDHVRPGDHLDVAPPRGTFVDTDRERPLLALAAGSGITPIFAIVKAALAERRPGVTRLLYANRDRDPVIFGGDLDLLAARHADRLSVVHHVDAERGFVDEATVSDFVGTELDARFFVCGPTEFMDTVVAALGNVGADTSRIHQERFDPPESATLDVSSGTSPPPASAAELTFGQANKSATITHRPGTTLLQAARAAGLKAPSSCETGTRATCMARVTDGEVHMRNNAVLTPDEVVEGWVLTCQAEPLTPTVAVVYE